MVIESQRSLPLASNALQTLVQVVAVMVTDQRWWYFSGEGEVTVVAGLCVSCALINF